MCGEQGNKNEEAHIYRNPHTYTTARKDNEEKKHTHRATTATTITTTPKQKENTNIRLNRVRLFDSVATVIWYGDTSMCYNECFWL